MLTTKTDILGTLSSVAIAHESLGTDQVAPANPTFVDVSQQDKVMVAVNLRFGSTRSVSRPILKTFLALDSIGITRRVGPVFDLPVDVNNDVNVVLEVPESQWRGSLYISAQIENRTGSSIQAYAAVITQKKTTDVEVSTLQSVPQSAAPVGVEGKLAYADGVNWDPGYGAGHYEYRGGSWIKLIGPASTIVQPNNQSIYWKDTLGTLHRVLLWDSGDSIVLGDIERSKAGYIFLNGGGVNGFAFRTKEGDAYTVFNNGNAPGSLIWEHVVSVNTTIVDSSVDSPATLSGLAHGGYNFEWCIRNGAGVAAQHRLHFNGDYTNTDYYVARVGATWVNDAIIDDALASGGWNIQCGQISVIGGMIMTNFIANLPNAVQAGTWVHQTKLGATSFADLTSLRIQASVAGGIGSGSRFRLSRVKQE